MYDTAHRDILNNALDYLLHSLRAPVDEPNEEAKDILPKYLILNLVAATELVLKARLCKRCKTQTCSLAIYSPPQQPLRTK